ncbi:carboxymuconolactone decarboxylase family protein [Pseudonocardia sp. MH-G8]|uniref:carboxymuconolactone decarboxylase family protein n=1 Tax=Pseudonocardia sp. MH-G8 TaxID=1854588 RepID=UPI000BA07654|nr:carboxymuconolactone decarboxylase family protein [Pseudonocardia sp. MH-G8]OZM83084.1 alkylhydroperoxidase [Pseudonocardia sp. MH-G8]
MARIPYPDLTGLPEQARAALDSMVAPLNLIHMCAHSPGLVAPIVKLSTAVLMRMRMPPRLREMLILRTASRVGCDYVLTQHRTIARGLGMSAGEIDAICADGARWAGFSEADLRLLEAADRIVRDTTLPPEMLVGLTRWLSHSQLVELFVVVGHYRMLSGLLNGLAVDIDPHGESFAELAAHHDAPGHQTRVP